LSAHFNNTPRRSIDVDSTYDDETSYDSTSQMSVDQNELDYLTAQNIKLMSLDMSNPTAYLYTNANTNSQNIAELLQQQQQQQQSSTSTNSFNMLKQQYFLQQQQYQDFTSFETIKKVLFNGTGGVMAGGSNLSSSGVGGGPTISPSGLALLNTAYTPGAVSNSMSQNRSVDNDSSQSSAAAAGANEQNEAANLRIINEFKQKPFDELKQTLLRSSQMNENNTDVLELISKEMTGGGAGEGKDSSPHGGGKHHHHHHNHHHGIHHSHGPAVTSVSSLTAGESNGTNDHAPSSHVAAGTNKNISYSSLSTNSGNSVLLKEAYPQQKTATLNDIEFPELFMYG
jgi:hypothetical protein